MDSRTRSDQGLLTLATLQMDNPKIMDSQIRFIVMLFYFVPLLTSVFETCITINIF